MSLWSLGNMHFVMELVQFCESPLGHRVVARVKACNVLVNFLMV